jgi:DGQHR domain-containing protein
MNWLEGEKPLNVIDGQHRLEAIRRLLADGHSRFSEYQLSITILLDLPYFEQAEMFSVINGMQKPVNRSRIYDLLGYLPTKDETLREKAYEGDMAIYRFCHQIVKVLNRSQASPWTGRIKMRGEGSGIVTQAAFVDQLANLVQPRKERARMSYLPVLYRYFRSAELLGAAKACVLYFQGIAEAWPQYWNDDARLKASLFGKTNGVVVMLMVLHDFAILQGGMERVETAYVAENWGRVEASIIDSPPAGGSRGYQRQIRDRVLSQMFGDGLEKQLTAAKDRLRDVLSEEGAIY